MIERGTKKKKRTSFFPLYLFSLITKQKRSESIYIYHLVEQVIKRRKGRRTRVWVHVYGQDVILAIGKVKKFQVFMKPCISYEVVELTKKSYGVVEF